MNQTLSSECLSNQIHINDKNSEETWVCDVAHQPRTAEDNLPVNQCSSYRAGKAKHFVEVTPECEFIRAV